MNIKRYEQLLIAENNILNKGYLSYEDLIQICEQRPWMIRALSEWLDLLPLEVKYQCSENLISGTDYFKAVNYFLRNNLNNLPVGLFNGEVNASRS